jgi:two-component system chemotaxis response regulator CheB
VESATAHAHRKLVVIGASAGGVETLKQVVARLPANLAATVCVVLHLAPDSPSALAPILHRAGQLPCHAAVDGEPLVDGQILVAPPDRHLVIEDGRARLTVGPRENNHRPAVDALFRSAAAARGPDVIGVVLSGTLDDGTAGLAVIKAQGGLAIVQDPAEALYPGMPASAIANVTVDAVVPAVRVADTIAAMVNGTSPDPTDVDTADPPSAPDNSGVTICPECGGVLTEHSEAGTLQWRCRVGHRYSPETLVDVQGSDVEAALWAAVRALEDRGVLLRRIAGQLEARDQQRSASRFRRRAHEAESQADLVRRTLSEAAETTLSVVTDDDDDDDGETSEESIA